MKASHLESQVARQFETRPALTVENLSAVFDRPYHQIRSWVRRTKGRRSPGRPKALAPSGRDLQILVAAQTLPYSRVAAQFGITKQRVGWVVKRWQGWKPPEAAPFVPGDWVVVRGGIYEVLEVDPLQGTLRGPHPKKDLRPMRWFVREFPVKVTADLWPPKTLNCGR